MSAGRSMGMSWMGGLLVLVCMATPGWAQLRIVSYNCNTSMNPSSASDPNYTTMLRGICTESVNGIANRPAILFLCELAPSGSSPAYITAMLNSINAMSSYTYAVITANSYERYGFVYDTSQVQLLETVSVYMDVRPAMRCKFRPVGYTSATAVFYAYGVHLKAYSGSQYELNRLTEVTQMRQDADRFAAGTNIIYLGDFNLTGQDAEAGYGKMLSAGNAQAFDPQYGHWTAPYYTYSSTSPYSRIDFQFVTSALNDGQGLALMSSSYHPYGNANGSTSQHPELRAASDHLPVVADYQVPAKMAVQVGAVAPRVLKNAAVTVPVTVTNAASVVASKGADKLDYVVTGQGSLSGSASGTAWALGAGNTHNLPLATAIPGTQSGQVSVTSSSQAVENGQFATSIASISVLEHATPSFSLGSPQNTWTADLGVTRQGRPAATLSLPVCNYATTPAVTAALNLDGLSGSGDIVVLATDITPPASPLSPGSQRTYTASLATAAAGSFRATYVLHFSDENLPGASSLPDLTLNLQGGVVRLGDVNSNGVIDADDIDALVARRGSDDSFADLDDSGLVDQADEDSLVHDILGTRYGDANLDLKVDIVDVHVLAAHWGSNGGWAQGEFNGDGRVNVVDLLTLTDAWGPIAP